MLTARMVPCTKAIMEARVSEAAPITAVMDVRILMPTQELPAILVQNAAPNDPRTLPSPKASGDPTSRPLPESNCWDLTDRISRWQAGRKRCAQGTDVLQVR